MYLSMVFDPHSVFSVCYLVCFLLDKENTKCFRTTFPTPPMLVMFQEAKTVMLLVCS